MTRKCIATGHIASPEGFVRFVLSPEGVVTPDYSGKLPGRGAWVTASRDALETAVRMNAFARAFRRSAVAPGDLADRVEAEFKKSALAALGLARRAGDAVVGFEKTRGALKDKRARVLIEASDGAQDGRQKLARLANGADIVESFTGRELSAALGMDGVIHAALKQGLSARRFLRDARRYEGFQKAPLGVE